MENEQLQGDDQDLLLEHTATIVASFASTNHLNEDGLASVIRRVYAELRTLGAEPAPQEQPRALTPAVPIKKSITPDYLVCLEDGAHVKLLKRYLASRFNMTPAEYRAKWGLPADYPMVAPAYAERRSTLAKQLGLGRKPQAEAPAEPPASGGGRGRKRGGG